MANKHFQTGNIAKAFAELDIAEQIAAQSSIWQDDFVIARRHGIFAYRQQQWAKAVLQFQKALSTAQQHEADSYIAKALNDLGNVARALDDYEQALTYFQQSLNLKRQLNDTRGIAITLVNIGHVLHKSGELEQAHLFFSEALRFLKRALTEKTHVSPYRIFHTEENLAQIEAEQGKIDSAMHRLHRIDNYYQTQGRIRDQQRIAQLALELCTAANQPCAEQWAKRTKRDLTRYSWARNAPTMTTFAEWLYQQNNYEQATHWVQQALLLENLTDADKLRLYLLQTKLAEKRNNWEKAYQALKAAYDLHQRQQKAQHVHSIENLKSRLVIQAQNHRLTQLEVDKARQSLALKKSQMHVSLLAFTILVLLLSSFALGQRKKRLWLQKRLLLHDQLRAHRNAYRALKDEYTTTLHAFDKHTIPQLLIGPDWKVDKVNDAFQHQFPDAASWQNRHLGIVWPELFSKLATSTRTEEKNDFRIRCPWPTQNTREKYIHISNCPNDSWLIQLAEVPQTATTEDSSRDDKTNEDIRSRLVNLLYTCLHAWEQATGKSKVDLAEESGIWRITIDGGRLRTRSLDRYLSLETMPKRPRWRSVVQTAHFVLAEADLSEALRQEIEQKLASTLTEIKRHKMI